MEQIEKHINNILSSDKSDQLKARDIYKAMKFLMDKYIECGLQSKQRTFADILSKNLDDYSNKIKALEELITKNELLEKQKEEINQKHGKLNERKNKLGVLIQQETFLKNHDLKAIEEDIKKRSTSITNISELYSTKIDSLLDFLKQENDLIEENFKAKLQTARENINQLQEMDEAILQELDASAITTKFKENKKNYEETIQDYNTRVTKLNTISKDLNEIKEKHSEIMEVYNAHSLENNEVFGNLEKREGVLAYFKGLQSEIDQKLKTYDEEIKKIIDKREELPLYELAEFKKHS